MHFGWPGVTWYMVHNVLHRRYLHIPSCYRKASVEPHRLFCIDITWYHKIRLETNEEIPVYKVIPSVHFHGWGMTIGFSGKDQSIQHRFLNFNGIFLGKYAPFLEKLICNISRAISTSTLHRTIAPLNCLPCSGTMLVMPGPGVWIFFSN